MFEYYYPPQNRLNATYSYNRILLVEENKFFKKKNTHEWIKYLYKGYLIAKIEKEKKKNGNLR
jgi:hypothetical protein